MTIASDRKSTRLNSSHTEIYTLSLHDALPITLIATLSASLVVALFFTPTLGALLGRAAAVPHDDRVRSEEHTSELQSHRDLHSFPTRRSSDHADRDAVGIARGRAVLHADAGRAARPRRRGAA